MSLNAGPAVDTPETTDIRWTKCITLVARPGIR